MAGDDDLVCIQKSLFESLCGHCQSCPSFDEQWQGLSDVRAAVIPGGRPPSEPSKKRKTPQQPASEPLSESRHTSNVKKVKRANTKGPQKTPGRGLQAVNRFLRNAPKATEWRKRQKELGLNTGEQYEQAIRALIDPVNKELNQQNGCSEHELVHREPEDDLVNLAERFAALTQKNINLQRSFTTFQILILLSYCQVLSTKGYSSGTIDRIIQHISNRYYDRQSLLKSALWVNNLIVALVSQRWTIYRATELFFIDALSTTSLLTIRFEEPESILNHLIPDESVEYDYSDCLRPEYTIPGLICSMTAQKISIGEICNALGYNSDCVSKSVKSIYKVHPPSKSTLTSLDLNYENLSLSSFQSNGLPTSESHSHVTNRASAPRGLHPATLSASPRRLPPNQDSVAITAPAYQFYSTKPASQALASLLSFFGQFKIPECLLERARGPLLTWGENGEAEEQHVNTVQVVQDKFLCDEAVSILCQLKAIHWEQSTDRNRYISVDPQVLTPIAYDEEHMKWRMEAVKVVLYAFPIDRRVQPLHSFSIAVSVLPLLKHVLPYLEEAISKRELPAAYVIEICLSASNYSTVNWKNNVIATAESIATRFPVDNQLQQRVELRKQVLSHMSSDEWGTEVRHLEAPPVDQRSNGYYGDFVLFNAEVLIGRQQLQAAFDELDRYTPWNPINISSLERFQIYEMDFLRGKIHHFLGHFKEARELLMRVLCVKEAEVTMRCKTSAHLTAVCCELGETELGITYASTQLNDFVALQSPESKSVQRLKLALAYAYLMQAMFVMFTQPTVTYTSLPRDIQEGLNKAHLLFQELARSYENASLLSRANKINQLSTLLGLALIAHIRDDLHGACHGYDIALAAANRCNWQEGYIEAIIYWSRSVVMHRLGQLEEAQKLNGLAGSLYQCRSYFFVGFGTLWPEIIGTWVVQQGRERIIPQQGWERNPELS